MNTQEKRQANVIGRLSGTAGKNNGKILKVFWDELEKQRGVKFPKCL